MQKKKGRHVCPTHPEHGETEAKHRERSLVSTLPVISATMKQSLGHAEQPRDGLHSAAWHGAGNGDKGAKIGLEQQTIHARLMHNGAIGPFNSFRADLTSTTFEQTETVEEDGEMHMSMFEQDGYALTRRIHRCFQ